MARPVWPCEDLMDEVRNRRRGDFEVVGSRNALPQRLKQIRTSRKTYTSCEVGEDVQGLQHILNYQVQPVGS